MGEVILAVDTSTSAGSVALCRGETLLGEIFLNLPRNHTDRLLSVMKILLTDTGIDLPSVDAFAVVNGPGSFTGLRVGVATVKGLAIATGKPLIAVSTLQALALQASRSSIPICAMLDARKKEVYACIYEWVGGGLTPRMPERVLPPEDLLHSIEGDTLFIGDGVMAYKTLIMRTMGGAEHFAPWVQNSLRASSLLPFALLDFREGITLSPEQLLPRYIRPSEAEIMWARREENGSIQG